MFSYISFHVIWSLIWLYRRDGYGRSSRDNETCPAQTPKWKTIFSKAQAESHTASTVRSRVCVVCAPPMRCMCAVTASDSRMSDGVRLQNVCSYIYIVSIEFFRRVRATIGFPLTLHKGTCLSSEKRSEESHNLHSGEPSRIRSKNIGTSLGKSSVQLKSYYARAHKTRCWLFAD